MQEEAVHPGPVPCLVTVSSPRARLQVGSQPSTGRKLRLSQEECPGRAEGIRPVRRLPVPHPGWQSHTQPKDGTLEPARGAGRRRVKM